MIDNKQNYWDWLRSYFNEQILSDKLKGLEAPFKPSIDDFLADLYKLAPNSEEAESPAGWIDRA